MSQGGHYSLRRIRRGAGHFLVGKLASAGLTFIAFAMTARLLGVREYGMYAALVAGAELLMSLSTLGMDWMSGRYLPEYRSRASPAQFRRFVGLVFGSQALVLLAVGGAVAGLTELLPAKLGLPAASLVALYAAVLLVEGSSRIVRDQLLGLLLAQGAAQAATVARALTLVLLLWTLPRWSPQGGIEPLAAVVLAELVAASLGLLVGGLGLLRLIRDHQPDATGQDSRDWIPPGLGAMARLARDAYLSMLLLLPASGSVLTLALSSLAGPQAAGAFGFARGLIEQIRRFLPIELFLGLIRPGVVARYVASRDFRVLNTQMGLIYALSMLAAMPVIAVLVAQAPMVAAVVGGTSFAAAAPVLAVWSATLLLFPHRRTIEVVANTAERSTACVAGSLLLALSPMGVALLLWLGAPVPLALAVPLLADIGFSLTVAALLHRSGLPYRLPLRTLMRLAALQMLAMTALAWWPAAQPSVAALTQVGVVGVLLTWGAALLWRPFSAAERAAINAVLPRPRFPF